jgi:hypothetical protein
VTTVTTRRAFSLRHAAAIGIAAAIMAGTASAWSVASPPAHASETGWQGELVNRPGCWTEGGYDNRYPCQAAGRH